MRDIKPYHIQSIVKDTGFGATCPIIVKANDKEYVLKTRDDGVNPRSLGIFNELLTYQLLDYLNINIAPQEVVYLYIDEDFIEMANIAQQEGLIQKESYDYIKASEGFNIGIEYLHNAMEPLSETITNKNFIKDISHIDNYIMNCDRAKGNINVLQDKLNQRKYYAIDFGNALADGLCYEHIQSGNTTIFSAFHECNATLSGRYIFREDVKLLVKRGRYIKENIANIRSIISDIIDNFPPDWEPLAYKNEIVEVISQRIKSRKIFQVTPSSKCQCLY